MSVDSYAENARDAQIERLKQDNERNESLGADAARFSRACTCCHKESRGPRYASTACGHALCRGCADLSGDFCEVVNCLEATTFLKLIEPEDGSRACPVCLCDQPIERCALRVCGHILCEACYHEIRKEALDQGAEILCPLCRSGTTVGEKTYPIWLREARIIVAEIEDDEEEESEDKEDDSMDYEEEIVVEKRKRKKEESDDSDIEVIEEIVQGPSVKTQIEQKLKKKQRDIEIVGHYGSTRSGTR